MQNYVQRFVFENLNVRGAVVRLDAVWQALLEKRGYPAPVVDVLGQICAVVLLLANNLKHAGRVTLQLRGSGPIPLLVVDCNESLNIRCMAQHEKNISATQHMAKLLGQGQLQLSLDMDSMQAPYQSIVPIHGQTIGEIFEHYLEHSEQVESRFFLAASAAHIGGIFLQKMPATPEKTEHTEQVEPVEDADGWERINALAHTVKAEELLELPAETLLSRLFHEEALRIFEPQKVIHDYPEDWAKVSNMLLALGREEVYSALKEHGEIVIRDDLSNHEYRFKKPRIDALFTNTPQTPLSIH